MAQGRSTKIISMLKWIWTSRLSIKKSLSLHRNARRVRTMLKHLRPLPRIQSSQWPEAGSSMARSSHASHTLTKELSLSSVWQSDGEGAQEEGESLSEESDELIVSHKTAAKVGALDH